MAAVRQVTKQNKSVVSGSLPSALVNLGVVLWISVVVVDHAPPVKYTV